MKNELGWEPSLQFEEGIEKTVKWYLENQEWLDNVTSGEAKLSKNTIAKGENVVLTIPVSNVGQRDGEEVVQVYLRRPGDKEVPPYSNS